MEPSAYVNSRTEFVPRAHDTSPEIVEVRDVVRFRPQAKGPGILEGVLLEREELRAVEGSGQDVPLTTSFSSCHVSTGIARLLPVKVVRFPFSTL